MTQQNNASMHCRRPAWSRAWLAMAGFLALAGCGRSEPGTTAGEVRPLPHEAAPAAGAGSSAGDVASAGDLASAAASESPVTSTRSAAMASTAGADPSLATFQPAAAAAPGRPMTLREAYPAYKPGADDPEFDSVARGRREVPVHSRTFESGGAGSLGDLVRMVVTGIDQADSGMLERASINLADFRSILWPEFPQSRPAAGVPVGEAWDFLHNRNGASFNRTTGDFKGQGLQVRSIQVGKVVEYTNFRLHDDITVTVTDAAGEVGVFPMIRTIAECRGRFKLYSTRD